MSRCAPLRPGGPSATTFPQAGSVNEEPNHQNDNTEDRNG